MNKKMVPVYLTVFRILLIAPIVMLLTFENKEAYFFASLLFLLACLTDMLDGYLSRKWRAQTIAGALLDPVADKILTLSVLVFLSHFGKIDPFLVILFLSRDIYVTGLRSIAANKNLILYAKPLAKWKTTFQMTGIFLILIGVPLSPYIEKAGYGLLWFCVFMSWISAWEYTSDFRKKFKFIEFSP